MKKIIAYLILLLLPVIPFFNYQNFKAPNPMNIPNFTPKNTAIIVIEFQKTWTKKGFFHWLVKKELNNKKVVANSITFLNKARKAGYPIIQAPLILDKKNKELYKKMPFIPKFCKAFTANTWKAEFTEGIYQPTDSLVTGRYAFDACKGSNLETLIADLGVKNLLFMGFTTEHCVEMTMQPLLKKGYDCVLISDCTATKSARLQKQVEQRQKKVISTDIFPFI